jgi:hypothetical protein
MPTYRVNCNQLYFNAAINSYEPGLLLGDSQLQFGDEIVCPASQVTEALANGDVVKV